MWHILYEKAVWCNPIYNSDFFLTLKKRKREKRGKGEWENGREGGKEGERKKERYGKVVNLVTENKYHQIFLSLFVRIPQIRLLVNWIFSFIESTSNILLVVGINCTEEKYIVFLLISILNLKIHHSVWFKNMNA